MATLFEGNFRGRVVDPEIGKKNGKYSVRWSMEVVDGPHAGKRANYSGKLDAENIAWTKRDMKAIGWKGKDATNTFVRDVQAANTIVPFTAEIVRWERPDGSIAEWTSAKLGSAPPLEKLDKDEAAKLDSWFDEVEDAAPPTSNGKAEDQEPLPF